MTFSFDPAASLVVVRGWVSSPHRTTEVQLAVDTGTTGAVIGAAILAGTGIVPRPSGPRQRVRGVAGYTTVPVVRVRQILALGRTRSDFPVAAHDLPPGTTYDGLLGLDFFRGRVLTFDFARGLVTLRPPRPWWRLWH